MDTRLKFARLLSILPALFMGAMLLTPLGPAQAAEETPKPGAHQDERHPNPERLRALITARLDNLSARLQLGAAQQPAWDAFAKSVEALAELPANFPGKDADAASIARFRADMAAGFARKLSVIADTTARLQTALNDKQRKIFNEEYRRMRRHGEGRCEPHGKDGAGLGRHDDGTDESGDDRP